ncbi:MAG TPA: hypothetical protein DD451_04165 [Candidatus Moranbacteria bacterium]|nr:hypothetical protein [Candidatus Moranbacteria bacterium]
MIVEWFFTLPMDFKILAWVGSFLATAFCCMFWGAFFLPQKKCLRCDNLDDPHEMFREADGSLLCRSCKAEKIAASIVSGCEHCH